MITYVEFITWDVELYHKLGYPKEKNKMKLSKLRELAFFGRSFWVMYAMIVFQCSTGVFFPNRHGSGRKWCCAKVRHAGLQILVPFFSSISMGYFTGRACSFAFAARGRSCWLFSRVTGTAASPCCCENVAFCGQKHKLILAQTKKLQKPNNAIKNHCISKNKKTS